MAETPKKRRDIGPSYRSAPHAHTSGLARREERKREAKEEESEREREYRRGSVYVFFLFFNRCLVWRRQSSREGLFFGLSPLEHFVARRPSVWPQPIRSSVRVCPTFPGLTPFLLIRRPREEENGRGIEERGTQDLQGS